MAELAAEILAAAQAGREWEPDYEDLMDRTGRRRRWCEYLVADARKTFAADAFRTRTEASVLPAPAEPAAPQDAEPGAEDAAALAVIPLESAGRVAALAGAGGDR